MSWENIKITPESVQKFFNEIDTDALTKNIDVILDKLDSEENVNHNYVSKNAIDLFNSAISHLSKENKSLNIMTENKNIIPTIKEPLAVKINTNRSNRDMIISNHKMINKFNLNVEKEPKNINYNSKFLKAVNSVSKNLKNKRAA